MVFGYKLDGAFFQAGGPDVGVVRAGKDDKWNVRAFRAGGFQHCLAAEAGDSMIGQDEINLPALNGG